MYDQGIRQKSSTMAQYQGHTRAHTAAIYDEAEVGGGRGPFSYKKQNLFKRFARC